MKNANGGSGIPDDSDDTPLESLSISTQEGSTMDNDEGDDSGIELKETSSEEYNPGI